ncbi:c-type cytochrome biogenesis protein CcmI [Cognatishimia maritima]|uniref:Cytochrome c-type biogenesis protein CcmH n=1 Tax=Cognatishimia maritima TaxID=870908 RepID=A0A1M5JPM3_9RHOB|nr:c-type cytochrome biogenesis protein CcmI [Cognatishimia maritima]SHG42240.1 cytochrome c-type biogenesis protein CcmH [Cognatishimia maritima]
MVFWITATGLTLITGLFLWLALTRGRSTAVSPAAYDLQVYRDQLSEVDRDLARGVISAEDAERVRTEVSRRILTADAQVQAEADGAQQRDPKTVGVAVVVAVFLLGGAAALYVNLGNPGYPDLELQDRVENARQMLQERPTQAAFEAQLPERPVPEADPEFLKLVADLRIAVADRPDDMRGLELLVRNEATLQNYGAAYRAQAQLIALKGESATSFDYTQLADLMIRAAQGYVSPEADSALRDALARDPNNGFARYYTGLMLSQTGRPDMTFRIWRDLLEAGPEAAPWIAPIRARISDLAWFAGIDYTPPAPRGPTVYDINAAQDLSEEDRGAMINAMVAGLADRLATEGGAPEEWAQLITAYGVLGDLDKAQVVWDEAQEVFETTPEALAPIANAARAAGLTE